MHLMEMSETEQQALRDGLRLLARMIARRHLEQRAIERETVPPGGDLGAEHGAGQAEATSR